MKRFKGVAIGLGAIVAVAMALALISHVPTHFPEKTKRDLPPSIRIMVDLWEELPKLSKA